MARKPIRPHALIDSNMKINLDMKNMDTDMIENDFDIKFVGTDMCKSRVEEGASFQRDLNTPSQTTSNRKSIEKWIYPDAQNVGKKKIDMARAILIDNNEKNVKKLSSQDIKLKNLNDSRSIRSDKSVEDLEGALNHRRAFGGQEKLGWISNKAINGKGLINSQMSKDTKAYGSYTTDPYQDEVILENQLQSSQQYDDILIENRTDPGHPDTNKDASAHQVVIKEQIEPVYVPQNQKYMKNLLEDAQEIYNEAVIFEKQSQRDYPYSDEQAEDSEKSIVDSPPARSFNQEQVATEEGPKSNVADYFNPKTEFSNANVNEKHLSNDALLKMSQEGSPSQDHRSMIENRDISYLNDLIDPNVMPQFDIKNPSVIHQVALAEQRHHELEQSVDEVANDILGVLFDELLTDGFVLRAMFKLQPDLPKGIKTNINCVKAYLSNLTEYIVSSFDPHAAHFIEGVKYQLNAPLGPTPEERLRLFHAIGDEENMDSSYAKINYEQVLDIDIYFRFEDELMVDSSYPRNKKKTRRSSRRTFRLRWSTSTINFFSIA